VGRVQASLLTAAVALLIVWWQAPLAQPDSEWGPTADVEDGEEAVDVAGQGDAWRDEPASPPAGQEGAAPANGQAGAVPGDSRFGSGPLQGPGEFSFPPAPPVPAVGRPLRQADP
jgi:hypothetical protein